VIEIIKKRRLQFILNYIDNFGEFDKYLDYKKNKFIVKLKLSVVDFTTL
jgi:hypothetical protein